LGKGHAKVHYLAADYFGFEAEPVSFFYPPFKTPAPNTKGVGKGFQGFGAAGIVSRKESPGPRKDQNQENKGKNRFPPHFIPP
jgi:hypothetical protein